MSCNNIEVMDVVSLPIDSLAQIPDYFLVERDILDDTDGTVKHTITRLPGAKVLPNGSLINTFTLDGNNPTLEIPQNQILPVYIQNQGVQNVVMPADATHPAQFFVVGTYGDLLLCQNVGVVNILQGHNYIVGMNYYRATATGQVTTDATQTGQMLFTPISNTQLLLRID